MAQAITKSLPLLIAKRVDEAIDRGRGGLDADAWSRKCRVRQWLSTCNDSVPLINECPGELWARNTRKRALDEFSNTVNTKELLEKKEVSSASITESTTRALESRIPVKRRE